MIGVSMRVTPKTNVGVALLDDASRVFWFRPPLGLGGNEDTLYVPPAVPSVVGMSRSALFFEFYDSIRLWIEKHRKPGLAVVALGEDGLQAKAHLSATEGVNTAIAGRHELAEIWLADDPAVSLRHLAVLVFSVSGRVRFRLIDLRTAAGFTDDAGHVLRACEAEEAFFIRCGRYSVLFVPTTAETSWPKKPRVIWQALRARRAATFAATQPATIDDSWLSWDEDALGELLIRSEQGTGTMAVGRRALRAGILLGRSDRCDGDVLLSDPYVSRVHLLIVELAGRLYAIDTASKNGVFDRGSGERVRLLEAGSKLSLSALASVEWRFFH